MYALIFLFLLSSCIREPSIEKTLVAQLKTTSPYADFSLGMSDKEKALIKNIKIKPIDPYDYFGAVSSFPEKEIEAYLKKLGNENAPSIAPIITHIVQKVLAVLKKDACWITIRSFTKTNAFDMPRWHTDGNYFDSNAGKQYKIAFTLKGPGTLFYNLPQHLRDRFNQFEGGCFDPTNRIQCAKLLSDKDKIHQTPPLHGTIFLVGDAQNAAVHSEPPIYEDRLFISIVPGTKSQIESLYKRWHGEN